MSLESNNSMRAPVLDTSVVSKLISDAPDDLDLGPDNPPEEPAEPVKPWDADDDEPEEEKPARKPKAAAKPKDEEPEEGEEPEEKPARRAAAPKEEAEPTRATLPKDRGTQDKPWTVKDLPEDGFIEIKVDGKKTTVSLKEAVGGYIRTETFQSALSRANNAHEEATQIAHDALQEREAIREYFCEVFKTPKKLFDRLMQDPDEMLELGQMIAAQFVKWDKGEESLQDYKISLRERRLAAREQASQQQRAQEEQQRNLTAQQRAAQERLRPVYQECLKEHGFPKLTPQFQKKFIALFRAEQQESGQVSPEAYRELFREAMLLVKPESTVQDRRPTVSADPPRAARDREAPRNGKGQDWSAVPLNQRLRSRDFLL